MIFEKDVKIILCSQSPRRRSLIEGLGFAVEITSVDVNEDFEPGIPVDQVAKSLSERKSLAYKNGHKENEVLLTADTLVSVEGEILAKPENEDEALSMLKKLNGNQHQVSTGFCLRNHLKTESFVESTQVFFNKLSEAELLWYIRNHEPYDKAGSYGIQEWIGYVGIQKVHGDFFNVIGLPLQRVYKELRSFLKE